MWKSSVYNGSVKYVESLGKMAECDEYLFLTKFEYQILFSFHKSPNTDYQILFGIEKIEIPNTEYYLVLRKSEFQIQIVLFGLTIQIPSSIFF